MCGLFRGRDKIHQEVGNVMLEPRRQVETGKIKIGILSIKIRSDVNFTLGCFPTRKILTERGDSRNKKNYNPAAYGTKTTFTER